MRRAGAATAIPGALLVLSLGAGCGLRGEEQPRELGASDAPFGVLATPPSRPQPPGQVRQRLFLVDDGALVPVTRPARSLQPGAALQDLLAGPTEQELDRGMTTALPAAAGLRLLRVEEGTAVVELSGDLAASGRTDQVLALGQVVATLDASPAVRAVRFVRDGQPLPVPAGDGALSGGPLRASDYASLLPAADAPSGRPGQD